MKFNMNAERYSIEQQENCVSTPEYNVLVLTELEEGNNLLMFISFKFCSLASNVERSDWPGQLSKYSQSMFSKVHHPIKNGGGFLPSKWHNFLDRSMCLFSEINSILRRMDEIDADFKVWFHGLIPHWQPDYSKPLASNLVGFTWEQSDNIPTTAKSCDKLQPWE